MNFIISLEISKEIGTGHFRRMLNLAKYMHMHNFIFLIDTDDKNNLIFRDLNIYFTNKIKELDDLKRIIKENDIDCLILDKLHYEKDYIKSIKRQLGINIVSFHEYDDLSEYSDLKINYNFFDNFKLKKNENFLAGPEYIIFNDELAQVSKKDFNSDYIFVSFGGSDPSFLAENFIKHIANELLDINFYIHIGNFNKLDISSVYISENINLIEQPANLFKYMSSAKYGITAAGNMMYELIYLKIPSIVIAHNSHQSEFAKNADYLGCVKYAGLAKELDFELLRKKIKLLAETKFECKQKIDALGVERIRNAIEELINEKNSFDRG